MVQVDDTMRYAIIFVAIQSVSMFEYLVLCAECRKILDVTHDA